MNLGIVGMATRKVGTYVVKHSPVILTGSAVVGTVLTAVFAGRATIKARDVIKAHEMDEELKCEKIEQVNGVETNHIVYYRDRTPFEKFKLTWRCFVPPTLMCISTISCILGSNTVNTKRNIALATAYSLSEETAREFRDKVKETIGEKKLDKINHEIAQDHLNKAEYDEKYVTYTGDGDQLWFDWWSQRYFKSSRTVVERKIHKLEKKFFATRKSVTMNEIYKELGLSEVPIGDKFGFKLYNGLNEQAFHIADYYPAFGPDQEPCTELFVDPELLDIY